MKKDIDTQTQSSICKGLDKGHSTSFSYPNPKLCHISTVISAILRKPSLNRLERTWANFMNTSRWSINKYSLKNISLYIKKNIYKEQRGMNKSFHLHSLILNHPWSLSTAGFSAIQDSPSAPLLPSLCLKPSCFFSLSFLDFSSDHCFYAGLQLWEVPVRRKVTKPNING